MYAKGTRSIWNGQDKHAKAENSAMALIKRQVPAMSLQATIKRSKNGIIKGIYNDTRGDVNRPICGVRGL